MGNLAMPNRSTAPPAVNQTCNMSNNNNNNNNNNANNTKKYQSNKLIIIIIMSHGRFDCPCRPFRGKITRKNRIIDQLNNSVFFALILKRRKKKKEKKENQNWRGRSDHAPTATPLRPRPLQIFHIGLATSVTPKRRWNDTKAVGNETRFVTN